MERIGTHHLASRAKSWFPAMMTLMGCGKVLCTAWWRGQSQPPESSRGVVAALLRIHGLT